MKANQWKIVRKTRAGRYSHCYSLDTGRSNLQVFVSGNPLSERSRIEEFSRGRRRASLQRVMGKWILDGYARIPRLNHEKRAAYLDDLREMTKEMREHLPSHPYENTMQLFEEALAKALLKLAESHEQRAEKIGRDTKDLPAASTMHLQVAATMRKILEGNKP